MMFRSVYHLIFACVEYLMHFGCIFNTFCLSELIHFFRHDVFMYLCDQTLSAML